MNDLIAISLVAIKVYLDSLFLLLFIFGAFGFSTYLYYRYRGLNQSDSVSAGFMVVLLITGFIMFYVGAIMITNPTFFTPVVNTTQGSTESSNDVNSDGWGLLGFGIAVISLSYSYLGNIETQISTTLIRIFLFRGRRFTRPFHEQLTSRQLFSIAVVWWVFTVLTAIYCLYYQPWFIIIPIFIAYGMLAIAIGYIVLGIHRHLTLRRAIIRRTLNIYRWILRLIIRLCIFCYLFPERFPEIFGPWW